MANEKSGYAGAGPRHGPLDVISDHHVVKFIALLVGIIGFPVSLAIAWNEHEELEAAQAQLKREQVQLEVVRGELKDSRLAVHRLREEVSSQLTIVLQRMEIPAPGVTGFPGPSATVPTSPDKIEQVRGFLQGAIAAAKRSDYSTMVTILLEPVMQENPIAQRIVGTAYACGCGVPADLERARAFMKKAADHGDADAREWIRQHPAQ